MPGYFRACPRYPLKVRVAVLRQFERGPLEVDGQTENLGFRGAFVRAEPLLPPKTRVVLSIASATTWDPLRIPGEVRWVRDTRPNLPGGMGIAFDPLSAEHAVALFRLFGAYGYEEE